MNVKKEIGVGIFFLILAVLYFLGSLSISTFNPFGTGEGITLDSRSLPQTLSALVGVLSLIHIITNALKSQKEKRQAGGDAQAAEKTAFKLERSQRIMIITVLLICAYIFCFTRLGFILASVLFLLAQIFILLPAEKRKSWAVFTVCFSTGVPVLIYFLFTRLLSMFLPRGLIG